MSDNAFLKKFMEEGLLFEMSDADYLKITQASSAVNKTLKDDLHLMLSAALVGFNPEPSESEPIFEVAKTAIQEKIPSFFSRGVDKPVQVYRAVVLDALNLLSSNTRYAGIIWYGAGQLLPQYSNSATNELSKELVIGAGNTVEKEAAERWKQPAVPNATLPNFKDRVEPPTIDKKYGAGDIGTISNGLENIQTAISSGLNLLSSAVNMALKQMANNLESAFESFVTEFNKNHRARENAMSLALNAQGYRVSLLYLLNTMYSPSFRDSYRTLEPEILVYAVALDVHKLSGFFAPQSCEYLIKEIIQTVNSEDSEISFEQYIENLKQHQNKMSTIIEDLTVNSKTGTVTLTDFILASVKNEEAELSLAVPKTTKLSFPEIAVWLFRDFKAKYLVISKP